MASPPPFMLRRLLTDLLPYSFYLLGSVCFVTGTVISVARELAKR